jgi:hypothetical protein
MLNRSASFGHILSISYTLTWGQILCNRAVSTWGVLLRSDWFPYLAARPCDLYTALDAQILPQLDFTYLKLNRYDLGASLVKYYGVFNCYSIHHIKPCYLSSELGIYDRKTLANMQKSGLNGTFVSYLEDLISSIIGLFLYIYIQVIKCTWVKDILRAWDLWHHIHSSHGT